MYYLYILKCSDNSLYTGITNNLEKRLEVHKSGKGSKYVRAKLPFQLVYSEELETKSLALKREFEIKKMTKLEKMKLVGNC
jgi:putative endonuclease